ncbi:MAG: hypothetical protein EBT39_04530, partial [Sphingobacteriia bacterium]|nr:hypothetical protein [Candidatus Fonsibacter lacus]
MEEIEAAFAAMIAGKIRNRTKSIALESIGTYLNAQNTSVMPVGTDGITTMHVLKTPEKKVQFFKEIFRLVNECIEGPTIPKITFKKYKIKNKVIDETKTRTVIIPCLRDQVVIRCILNKLNSIGIVDEENKPNPDVVELTTKIRNLILSGGPKKIIRTDIANYYPSINTEKLLQLLQASHGHLIDPRIMNLIRKVLIDNKSKDGYSGLPLGVGFCVLLANYYIAQMKLSEHFQGIDLVRYEDDIMFIVDEKVDENEILARLDAIYDEFGIKRSEKKTEIFDAMSAFKYIGVNYEGGKVFIGDEKFTKWKVSVAKDIKKQFRDFSILKTYDSNVSVPSNKELVNKIWKAHKKGERSKVYQHSIR